MVDKVEDLKTYLAVLDMGGINAAAAELGIAKSAVSRRLSDLEKRLGVGLVDRSTRGFEPTAVGLEYARRARAILSSLDELDASVTEGGGSSRTLAVRSSPGIIARRLVPALATLGYDPSQSAIRFSTDDDASGKADIVVGDRSTRPGEVSRALFKSRLVLCASPSYLGLHPAIERAQQLDNHAAIAVSDTIVGWQLPSGIRRSKQAPLVVPDEFAAVAAAVAGLGLTQLPDFMVSDEIAAGRLVPVLAGQESAPTEFFASFSDSSDVDTRKFVDGLAAALA